MEIRQANELDVLVLSRMNVHVQQLHAEAYPDLFKIPESDDFAAPLFTAMLEDPEKTIFIAKEDIPVGYIVLRVSQREENTFMHAWRLRVYRSDLRSAGTSGQRCGNRFDGAG